MLFVKYYILTPPLSHNVIPRYSSPFYSNVQVIGTSATVLKVGPKVYEKISPLVNLINKLFPKEVAVKLAKWLGDMILGTVLFLEKAKREVTKSKKEVKVTTDGETPA